MNFAAQAKHLQFQVPGVPASFQSGTTDPRDPRSLFVRREPQGEHLAQQRCKDGTAATSMIAQRVTVQVQIAVLLSEKQGRDSALLEIHKICSSLQRAGLKPLENTSAKGNRTCEMSV